MLDTTSFVGNISHELPEHAELEKAENFDKNLHTSNSDSWWIFCGQRSANSFHHFFCFFSYLFRGGDTTSLSVTESCILFCPHVFPSNFPWLLVRDDSHFLPSTKFAPNFLANLDTAHPALGANSDQIFALPAFLHKNSHGAAPLFTLIPSTFLEYWSLLPFTFTSMTPSLHSVLKSVSSSGSLHVLFHVPSFTPRAVTGLPSAPVLPRSRGHVGLSCANGGANSEKLKLKLGRNINIVLDKADLPQLNTTHFRK